MVGVQADGALLGLARLAAVLGAFDAMVHGVAHQVGQRVGQALDHGLVQFGLRAADAQHDVLAQLCAHVPDHALEPVEGAADLDHAQVQRRIAHLFHQAGDGRGRLHHVLDAVLAGRQQGPGSRDDELAHQVDQAIELGRVDAQHLRFRAATAFSDGVLLGQGRIDHGCVDLSRFDQHLAQGFDGLASVVLHGLGVQRGVQLGPRQRAAANQDLAQSQVGLGQFTDQGDVFMDLAVRWQDAHTAFVTHEVEGRFDLGLVGVGLEADFETEVALVWLELGKPGHVLGQGFDVNEFAEGGQVAREAQGVEAVLDRALAKAKRDVPVVDTCRLAALRLAEVGAQAVRQRLASLLGGGVGLALFFDAPDQVAQVITSAQQQARQRQVDRQAPGSDLVEHTLGHVGELDDVVQAEDPGRAFDGVGRAEDGVDDFAVLRVALQLQQRAFHLFEQFPAFGEEGLQGFIHAHGATSLSSHAKTSK